MWYLSSLPITPMGDRTSLFYTPGSQVCERIRLVTFMHYDLGCFDEESPLSALCVLAALGGLDRHRVEVLNGHRPALAEVEQRRHDGRGLALRPRSVRPEATRDWR
jgi:hypothetical protein